MPPILTPVPEGGGAAGGTSLGVKEEGSTVVAVASALNFVGASVTVTDGGSGTAVVTITDATLTTEQVQDIIGAIVAASGPGLTVTYDDAGNAITFALNTEAVQDIIGALVAAGTGITVTYDDTANTLTIASSITQYTDEMARDALGTAITAGAGIAKTVDDAGDTITLATTVAIPADKTADYTLVLGDAGSSIGVDSASGKNVTVPPNSSVAFPVGTVIEVREVGVGQVTLVAGSGVTLRSAGGALKIRAQYGGASLLKVATDTWSVQGDLTT